MSRHSCMDKDGCRNRKFIYNQIPQIIRIDGVYTCYNDVSQNIYNTSFSDIMLFILYNGFPPPIIQGCSQLWLKPWMSIAMS